MSKPIPVDGQITDAATQTNVKVVAEAPAMALATLHEATAQALSDAAENAVQAQREAMTSSQAAANQGVIQIYGSAAEAPPRPTAPRSRRGRKS